LRNDEHPHQRITGGEHIAGIAGEPLAPLDKARQSGQRARSLLAEGPTMAGARAPASRLQYTIRGLMASVAVVAVILAYPKLLVGIVLTLGCLIVVAVFVLPVIDELRP
jgi:hypothetical protein